ncbi:hypothetical protein JVY00_06670 [Tsukamurella tyrosinosolvens]|uniref:hypothetical protein n=1 Tax=Tsukamurella tyrosinosolvens TaxID=57704 RepID=UPI001AF04703|nr:hypothetical protein [Tsukamurella tyrosinosolvens]QRY85749.1 hypothetical protein JVY00_06670 [Tsukamurella tyrosinosolvens]
MNTTTADPVDAVAPAAAPMVRRALFTPSMMRTLDALRKVLPDLPTEDRRHVGRVVAVMHAADFRNRAARSRRDVTALRRLAVRADTIGAREGRLGAMIADLWAAVAAELRAALAALLRILGAALVRPDAATVTPNQAVERRTLAAPPPAPPGVIERCAESLTAAPAAPPCLSVAARA